MYGIYGILSMLPHCLTRRASPERSAGMDTSDPDDRGEREDRAIHLVGWALLVAVLLLGALAVLLYL